MATDPYAALGQVVAAPTTAGAGDAYSSLGDTAQAPAQPDNTGSIVGADGKERKFSVNPDGKTITWLDEQTQPSALEQIGTGLGQGTRDILGGGGKLLNLVTSPVTALEGLVGIKAPDYEAEADALADRLGLPRDQGVLRELRRGIVSGLLTAGTAAPAAGVGGATGAVADALSAAPLTEAAASGASAGAGEATREAGGGPNAQAVASILAGGAAGLAGARAGAVQRVAVPQENAIVGAAGRQGIDLLPADVGGPTVRRLTAAAAQAPISASPIVNASQRVLQQGQAAASRIASTAGDATDAATAGEAARTGAQAYIDSSRRAGGALYANAAKLAGDTTIDPANARQVLNEQISRLQAVPGGGQGLEQAQALRHSLNGKFTVQGIRDMRTEMFVAPELRSGPAETRMRQVVDAASQDVQDGLRAQGKNDAADAFAQADAFWKDRLNTIDQVIKPVIGSPSQAKGGEAITKSIDTAARGDVARLKGFLDTLPDDQSSVVRASFINRLGMAAKGQQNAQGDAFSLNTFLTNWNALSPRSKAVLFNPEQKASLQDLATVANGVKNASRYANHSNTSGGIWGNLGVLAGGAAASPVAAGTGLTAQLIGGRLLASPRFARWLARAPRTQLSNSAYIDRLTRIAAAEPAISGDVLHLRDRLLSAANDGSAKVAAQEPDNEGNRVDR